MELVKIATMHTDFPSKFGIPRQAGMAPGLEGRVVFEPAWRNEDAIRGLDGFSHIWVIWGFSLNPPKQVHSTVRPPILGGNERMGVFATRSPFRPNPLGLSSLRILRIMSGPELIVESPDMADGTPIYDIKPYVPHADIHLDAKGGFADTHHFTPLLVQFPPSLLSRIPEEKRSGLLALLEGDPRPPYQKDEERSYGFLFDRFEIKFRVKVGTLTVTSVMG